MSIPISRRLATILCLAAPLIAQAGPYSTSAVFGDNRSQDGSGVAQSLQVHAVRAGFPAAVDGTLAASAGYGFANVTDRCLDGSASAQTAACAAAEADQYPFWDGAHPTVRPDSMLTQRIALALGVPEPSEMTLIFIGLLVIVAFAQRAMARRRGMPQKPANDGPRDDAVL